MLVKASISAGVLFYGTGVLAVLFFWQTNDKDPSKRQMVIGLVVILAFLYFGSRVAKVWVNGGM